MRRTKNSKFLICYTDSKNTLKISKKFYYFNQVASKVFYYFNIHQIALTSHIIHLTTLTRVKIPLRFRKFFVNTRENVIWTDAEIRLTTFGPAQEDSAEKVSRASFPRAWIHRRRVIKYFWVCLLHFLIFFFFFSRQEIFTGHDDAEERAGGARRGFVLLKEVWLRPNSHT